MKELRGDEDFLRINQNVNIFDIVSCKEEQASQIIAWLLNPREAHGFGSKFFEAMLDKLDENDFKIYGKKDKISIITDCKEKYKNVIIQTEYCFNDKCKSEDGRIDIFLCLEDAKTLFIIENKYGAKEHNEQTKTYYNHFSKNYRGYNKCYIYLDFKGYYEDSKNNLADSEHWNIINYDWIVDFLKENLTGSYVDKILQDIYIEFTGNYEEEPYFHKFFNQKMVLYDIYKEDIKNYSDPYPYTPNSKNLKFALYNGFYSTLSEYSNWDKITGRLKDTYCIDDTRNVDISVTLKEVGAKYDESNKNANERKKWWPFYVNIKLNKPKDEKSEKSYLEIKLLCTNEYINDNNEKLIQEKLTEKFSDKKIKNKIGQKIVPFKSGESIKVFFLKKDMIENFDFENEDNINSLIGKIEKYKPSLEEMYNIFFPKENR